MKQNLTPGIYVLYEGTPDKYFRDRLYTGWKIIISRILTHSLKTLARNNKFLLLNYLKSEIRISIPEKFCFKAIYDVLIAYIIFRTHTGIEYFSDLNANIIL